MTRYLAALVILLVAFGGGDGARSEDGAAAAIREVIASQLAAFRRGDGAQAFSHASPGIKRVFRTPESFMAMVQQGYAPVYNAAEVEFRELEAAGTAMIQRVFIRGANGEAVIARYTMTRMPDGSWRINGCELERLPEVAA